MTTKEEQLADIKALIACFAEIADKAIADGDEDKTAGAANAIKVFCEQFVAVKNS